MATLNMRYGGKIVSLPEGFNFNANYGTARLNIKVNNTSTLKFGLTTNTNATEYCGLGFRINKLVSKGSTFSDKYGTYETDDLYVAQTAHIGRVYSTSYVDRAGIAMPPRLPYPGYTAISSKSQSSQSVETNSGVIEVRGDSLGIYSSYCSTDIRVTSVSTKITGQQTASYTRNAGNGSGTAAANPGVRIVTNNTGSWYTTRTASEAIATYTYYSFSYSNTVDWRDRVITYNRTWPAVGANRTYTQIQSQFMTRTMDMYYGYVTGVQSTAVKKIRDAWLATSNWAVQAYSLDKSSSISTTRRLSNTSASNKTTGSTAGAWKTVETYTYSDAESNVVYFYTATSRTLRHTYTSKQTTKASIVSTSKTTYSTRRSSFGYVSESYTAQAIQPAYRYSTRWSYWWTSCSKYTNTTYLTGSTNFYGTTYWSSWTYRWTSVSSTLHNMNI